MELTDTHCHIHSVGVGESDSSIGAWWTKAGVTDPDAVIRRANERGVTRFVCVGTDLEDSKLAVGFVSDRQQCWASVGIHPHEARRYVSDLTAAKEFALLANAPKVVAIGECGLDYYYEHSPKDAQIKLLKFHIEVAIDRNLPLIFHVRDAYDDFWPVFESYQSSARPLRGVLHSFTDNQANLERGLKHGLSIGVNGIATFTKDSAQKELYRTLPLESLLLETDAPFLTPTPDRGKICESYHIRTIAEFLANERGESLDVLAQATTQNAQRLFATR